MSIWAIGVLKGGNTRLGWRGGVQGRLSLVLPLVSRSDLLPFTLSYVFSSPWSQTPFSYDHLFLAFCAWPWPILLRRCTCWLYSGVPTGSPERSWRGNQTAVLSEVPPSWLDLGSHHSLSEWGLGLLYQGVHSNYSTRTGVDGINPSIQVLDLLGSRLVLASGSSVISASHLIGENSEIDQVPLGQALKIRSLASVSHWACSVLERIAGTWPRQQTAAHVHKKQPAQGNKYNRISWGDAAQNPSGVEIRPWRIQVRQGKNTGAIRVSDEVEKKSHGARFLMEGSPRVAEVINLAHWRDGETNGELMKTGDMSALVEIRSCGHLIIMVKGKVENLGSYVENLSPITFV
ncbi:hypothetical protein Acr_04g0010090 [Actinidia rufa]|uniref:Uncharacterized protein n=1 Tax=Actinidia rufa TaxID=165716 RepID=A0A7J0EIH7_9ERIC|nr:hypothetical protein Acr_04g0010090 [Actinidia rufa]